MAMAQLASSTPSGGASSGPAPSSSSSSAPKASSEIQALLGQFDAQINSMMDYPAKDTINALTMLAERSQFAPEVVSFLETKIHRVAPNCKLPIFYLTDSILKNVRGPYLPLFAAKIVPLYCNCVRQVSGKDLKRFIHVLNTWETTKLFNKDAIAQMRAVANRAMQQADPSARSVPASFNQETSSLQARAPSASSSAKLAQQQQDMELRSLLTKLQNDMGIHPTEHMSLEEVRTNNPDYYNQLLEFHAASKVEQASSTRGPGAAGPGAPPQRGKQPSQQHAPVSRVSRRPSPPNDPRAGRARAQPSPQQVVPPPSQASRAEPPRTSSIVKKSSADDSSAAKSSNVAHLMQLLKRKQRAPSPPQQPVQEITNDPPRAPDAAAVMSILQKLKDMSNGGTSSGPPTSQAQTQQIQQPQQPQQGNQQQQAPPRSDNASRMWFSDKVVAHKDRVESNVQKLYAVLPLVCRESGLRFREQAQLDAHLDFLFQYNRARKERGKGGVSRSWYPDEDQWVADFSGDTAPRESTSSSFFDRTQKEIEKNAGEQASWENACVTVDETITHCRICGEHFSKSWNEEEEDWMYTNAVAGTIHNTGPHGNEQQDTIFHKYCYDTVMANSKQVTPAHLIPAERDVAMKGAASSDDSMNGSSGGVKRSLDEDDSDSDGDDDVKRVKTD
ncbi:hypothetical protein PHYPSEUDO_002403 [Phytophthora pseudosyringae]|uniref:CID domain-containing protein n=1 Tax=Phytophthora pseudosyringae TaxID=221518 RepID=A0A8T1VUM5_9STRA|nr:hypothetical protein PHYPSEUDO_002403 [Phytophthora pseudosyringae]